MITLKAINFFKRAEAGFRLRSRRSSIIFSDKRILCYTISRRNQTSNDRILACRYYPRV